MALLLDEAGNSLLDEALFAILDEAGAPVNVNGLVANVSVAAPMGMASGQALTLVTVESTSSFQARTAVTAQATMEFEAGQPVQAGLRTLAADQWFSMYPG